MSDRVYAASTCGGGKHEGFEEERKPVDLTGGPHIEAEGIFLIKRGLPSLQKQ